MALLRIVITHGDGPPRIFERRVQAPIDDVAAAVSTGMVAFDESFTTELAWIEQRSKEEAAAFCKSRAA
jgi:hypothetical protein